MKILDPLNTLSDHPLSSLQISHVVSHGCLLHLSRLLRSPRITGPSLPIEVLCCGSNHRTPHRMCYILEHIVLYVFIYHYFLALRRCYNQCCNLFGLCCEKENIGISREHFASCNLFTLCCEKENIALLEGCLSCEIHPLE